MFFFFGYPVVTCLHTYANTVPAVPGCLSRLATSPPLLNPLLFHLLSEAREHTSSNKVASVSAIGQRRIIGEDF